MNNDLWDWVMGSYPENGHGTDTQYKMAMDSGVLYIAFQGSISKKDWLQNFRAWVRPYKHQPFSWFAHSGFVRKWKSIEEDILGKVREDKPRDIHLLGHSQGGAIAILAHEDICFNFLEYRFLLKTTTYGSPRVISAWNWDKLEPRFSRVIRVAANWDIVPHLPPAVLGFRHMGNEERFNPGYAPWDLLKNHLSYGEYKGRIL